jgi:uncharacterized repeat protein (TIGR03803 family)
MLEFSDMQISFRRMNSLLVLAVAGLICTSSHAQNMVVAPIHTFSSRDAAGGVPTEPISLFVGKFDGALYGVTYKDQTNGSIFTVKTDGSGYAVLHSFALGDEIPNASGYGPGQGYLTPSVVQGNDGVLYGTTPGGGTNNSGTFFKLNPNGTGYTVLRNFPSTDGSPGNLIQGSDGLLYGAGNSVFKVDINGSNYTVLHSFTDIADGFAPAGLVQGRDGVLYGTTFLGGTNGNGTLFSVDTNGASFKVLHTFQNTEAANSAAGLIQGSDGALYGTLSDYATAGAGAIFKVNSNGDNFMIMHKFAGGPNDGSNPLGSLVEGTNQVLYGTAYAGGRTLGTIFKIGLDGSNYASLYYFTNGTSLGVKPITGLAKDPANPSVFYGTTSDSGSPLTGSIFAALVSPLLSVTPVISQTVSNQAVLFWPRWAGTYSLQSTTNIASGNWTTVTDAVPVFGVQVTTTNPAVFYRLVSP